MKKKYLDTLVLLFIVLALAQLSTGLYLFYLKTGFTVQGIQEFYRADLFSETGRAKSFIGIIEVTAPHILTMSLFFFVCAHFLLFIPELSQRKKSFLTFTTASTMLFYNLSPFLISFHSINWAIFMLSTLVTFQLGLICMLFQCFFYSFGNIRSIPSKY